MNETILERSTSLQPWLTELRRSLHTMPGTGFDTDQTRCFVWETLEKLGCMPQRCGKGGITALIGSGEPVFLLRADMDGLPVREEADIPFPSENGNMHACGHDLHTAMLLGAARLLKEREGALQGSVKLMFQSAEEIFQGAADMLEAGVLEEPPVAAGMMVHVISGQPIPTGSLIVCDGGVSAPGADIFTVTVKGKGCHGSMPHTGIDPITAAAHIIIALQELSAREVPLMDGAVLTVGSIHAGDAPNVIPDTAQLQGSLRTYSEDLRSFLKERIEGICEGIASAFRTRTEVSWGSGCPALENDPLLSRQTAQWAKELLGPGKVFTQQELHAASRGKPVRSAGSEDYAWISQRIPTIMVSLAAGHPKDGHVFPLHHPRVTFDETALPIGAAVLADTALRWLEAQK